MSKKVLSLLLMLCLILTGILVGVPVKASETQCIFYVSPQGNDNWSGALSQPDTSNSDGPFKTITKAKDAIRALKSTGALTQPVTVYIREGTYYLDQTITFTPDDSGTAAAPITYAAYPGEKPVISGGKPINGLWKTDDGNIYYADIPEASNGAWKFRSLFVDESREISARYPNYIPDDIYGYSYIYAYPEANQILAGLAKEGDFVDYKFNAAVAGNYKLWISYTTTEADNQNFLSLTIDGQAKQLGSMPTTGGWRSPKYYYVANVSLTAGEHILHMEDTSYPGEHRVHLDAFAFSDSPGFQPTGQVLPGLISGENRIVIEAENDESRIDGYSSITFQKFSVAPTTDKYTIRTNPDKIKTSWVSEPDAFINLVPQDCYYNEIVSIDSIDKDSGMIKVKGAECEGTIIPGNYFYVSGVKEELDVPGEWYLDSTQGRLYYWPIEGKDPNDSVFIAPRLDRLIEMQGNSNGTERVSWINLCGLTFEHCADSLNHIDLRTPTDGAVRLTNAFSNKIENCLFTNIDGFGVWLHLDSCENIISGNTMEYMGTGGILMTSAVLGYGGATRVYDPNPAVAEYAPMRNIIKRNLIHDGNQVRINGAGILMDSRPASTALKTGNLILYNDIYHMKRQGIFAFRYQGGNVVAYNHIHHVMLESADGGGINFAVTTNEAAPILIKNNLVHDVWGLKHMKEGELNYYQGAGIYYDWGTSRVRTENNVVYHTVTGYLNNGGQFNSVINNIFADSTRFNLFVMENSTDYLKGVVCYNNIFANTSSSISQYRFTSGFGPHPDDVNNVFKTSPSSYIKCDKNTIWNAGNPFEIELVGSFEQWKGLSEDINSVVANPLFVDPANGNYSLDPGSPAYGIGFKPIDISNVGINAQAQSEPDLTWADVLSTSVKLENAEKTGENARNYMPSIGVQGNYMVYTKGASPQDSNTNIKIEHADGVTRTKLKECVVSESSPTTGIVYVGTYRFAQGNTGSVTVEMDNSSGTQNFPAEMLFVQANPLNEPVSYIREITLASDKYELEVGQTAQLTPIGIGDDGSTDSLSGYEVTYHVSDPTVVDVDANGLVTAKKTGKVYVTAEASVNGLKIKSLPFILKSGSYLNEVKLSALKYFLKPGEDAQFKINALSDTGNQMDISTAIISYVSDNPAVIGINNAGGIVANATGSANVCARVVIGDVIVVSNTLKMVVQDERETGPVDQILHYSFDEASQGATQAIDSGINPANGVFFGAATRTADTPGGFSTGALDLNSSGSNYVTPGVGSIKLNGLNAFTISLWVNMRDVPVTYERFITKGGPLGNTTAVPAFEWTVDSGSTAANIASSFKIMGSSLTMPSFPVDKKWRLFVFTYDGTVLNAYMGDTANCVQLVASSNIANKVLNSAGELRIGSTTATTADRTPPAYFDDVRIYNAALMGSELDKIRNENLKEADMAAPVTTAQIAGSQTNGWYNSDVAISLAASDNFSEVFNTYYSTDGGVTWKTYYKPVNVTAEGINDFRYYSIDWSQNKEDINTIQLSVDKTAAVTSAVAEGTKNIDGTYNSNVMLTLAATDTSEGSGVEKTEYSFDGANWLLYNIPLTLTNDGTTTVSFRSYDIAGNVEAVQSINIDINKTPEVLISELIKKIEGVEIEHGIQNSLTSKLDNAMKSLMKDKDSAVNKMNAFINEVDAQTGKKLTAEQANALKTAATKIISKI